MGTLHLTKIASIAAGLMLVAIACTYASADQSKPPFASEFTPEMVDGDANGAPAQVSKDDIRSDHRDVRLANGVLRQAVAATVGEGDFPRSLSREADSVRVEILHSMTSEDIAAFVASLGGNVYGEVPGVLAEALVPIASLVRLEAHPLVEYVRPPLAVNIEPYQPPTESDFALPHGGGAIIGEEVAKTNADAWHDAGYTGQGVKIGIIDSFDSSFWNPAQAAGEVPAPSGTFCQLIGSPCDLFDGGGDHGIAVAEIIHEMAPDAQLYLATVYTVSDIQAAVNYFDSMGVHIISRSQTTEFDGPGDGTGPMDAVLDNAVSKGMVWFNAAGNTSGSIAQPGDGSYWRGSFIDVNLANNFNEFDNFTEVGEGMPFGCGFVNGVRWNDWGPNPTDYDIYIWDEPPFDNTTLEVYSFSDQANGAPPVENFTFQQDCDSENDIDYLGIEVFDEGNGTAGDVLEFMTNGTGVYYWQNAYSASTPFSDTANAGGLSIGAIDPPNGNTIGSYSAWGPTNDERTKPDLSTAAGVVSYTYGSRHSARFGGTSAATPTASGATALVIGAGIARTAPAGFLPTTPAQVKTFLLNNTVDRGDPGPDIIYGEGELVLPNPPAGQTSTPTPTGGATPTPTGAATPTPTLPPTPTPTNPPDEPDKKLFNGRWDLPLIGNNYNAWMDLATSQPYYDCDGGAGAGACANKWSGPVEDALDDWNSKQTTVRFVLQPGQSDDHEVHIIIDDTVLGDPSLLGLAVFYDENVNQCNPEVCDWRYGDALIGDDAHSGVFSGVLDKQATTAHEVGHLLSLRHESVNATETVLFPCGMDDTGPIPHSVMSYNCIDPVGNGGAGEYYVQDWDVCGVNNAYFDPNVGMAGCQGGGGPSPTETPPPGANGIKGDNDCDGDADAVDALVSLQTNAGLNPNQQPGCPELGSALPAGGQPDLFGDIDCDDDVDAVDALQILRHVAGLGANLPFGCPAIGTPIAVG